MFAGTHKILAHHIATHVKEENHYEFNAGTFAWANMKPDFIPALAIKKHYIEESFPFVVDEILKIIQTPKEDLLNKRKKAIFDAKMGVICHFVSDFFCVPHNQRWEFKHSMIPHVKYEVKLEGITKGISTIPTLTLPSIRLGTREAVTMFLRDLLDEYEQKKDYKRDLLYSVNVCTAISFYVLEAIMNDQKIYEDFNSFTA